MRLLFLSMLLLLHGFGQAQRILLNEGWEFFHPSTQQWLPATVPGNIQQDLLRRGLMLHPYFGTNEDSVQWVGEQHWIYRLIYTVPDSLRSAQQLRLRFESLDTYCGLNIYAHQPGTESPNPRLIQHSSNRWVPVVMDISELPRDDTPDTLMLHFASPHFTLENLAKERRLVAATAGNDVGEVKLSPFARKPAYHFGWDWAPRILTQGIRGDVWLEADIVETETMASVSPRVELVREQDSIGESYFFRINGKAIFMKGANYVPLDDHLPEGRQARIREMLLSARDAGFNMIRVWGGGTYEEEYFYDLCDSLGIYVWQDFMFACSMYPADVRPGDRARLDSYQKEAEAQVKRLRHHPCIVLWCGNNEIEVAWNNWGWQQQIGIHGQDSVQIWNEYLSIFDTLLPSVVQRLDPQRPYVSTSPLSNWGAIERFNSGDNHYWGVWHGEEPFENFRTYVPRFMSEYGFQSFPDYALMQAWGAPQDTSLMRWHQKSYKGSRMITEHAEEWFGKSPDLPTLIRRGQFAQAEAYRIAIESHRAAMPRCMGTLYWQLNDCWPGPSWSTLDYALNWKPAHYMVKRMYADRLALAARTDSSLTLSVSNLHQPEPIRGFEWQVKDFKGRVRKSGIYSVPTTPQLRLEGEVLEALMRGVQPRSQYLRIKLLTPLGINPVLHLVEEKPSQLRLPRNPHLTSTHQILPDASVEITLSVRRFAKGVWLELPFRDEQGKLLYRFSDNYFDLEPGETKKVRVIPTTKIQAGSEQLSKLIITHCNH